MRRPFHEEDGMEQQKRISLNINPLKFSRRQQ